MADTNRILNDEVPASPEASKELSWRREWLAMKLYEMVGNRYNHLLVLSPGQGEMLQYFREAGYRVEAWGKSPEIVHSLTAAGYRAKLVDIERDQLEGSFDLIACCDLIRFVTDPASLLRKLTKILARNGRLFLEFPNDRSLFNLHRTVNSSESAIRYSPGKSKELAQISNLEVVETAYGLCTAHRWGRLGMSLGHFLANLLPILFCRSTLLLVKRQGDK